jgi:(5R)-carbapenem-3-carboxylate synthase
MINNDTREQLRSQGWVLIDGRSALGRDGPATWLERTAAELAAPHVWPQPVGAPTVVRANPHSAYATLRAGAVPFHNDGLYLHTPPRYLLLLCEEPAADGGETLLVHGAAVLAALGAGLLERLRTTPIIVRVGDYRTQRCFVARHPDDRDEIVLLFDPTLADGALATLADGASAMPLLDALRDVVARVPARRHKWRRGDLLVIDNLRVLHARSAYTGERQLHRRLIGPHAGGRSLP